MSSLFLKHKLEVSSAHHSNHQFIRCECCCIHWESPEHTRHKSLHTNYIVRSWTNGGWRRCGVPSRILAFLRSSRFSLRNQLLLYIELLRDQMNLIGRLTLQHQQDKRQLNAKSDSFSSSKLILPVISARTPHSSSSESSAQHQPDRMYIIN